MLVNRFSVKVLKKWGQELSVVYFKDTINSQEKFVTQTVNFLWGRGHLGIFWLV